MDAREYTRAAHWLKECQSEKALFLQVYSQYLASEKKALRDWYKLDNTKHQPPVPVNGSILELLQLVQNSTDPWHLFLPSSSTALPDEKKR